MQVPEGRETIKRIQHRVTKGSLCLSNMITYKEMTASVDEGRVMNVVCLDFNCDIFTYSVLTAREIWFGYVGYKMH